MVIAAGAFPLPDSYLMVSTAVLEYSLSEYLAVPEIDHPSTCVDMCILNMSQIPEPVIIPHFIVFGVLISVEVL